MLQKANDVTYTMSWIFVFTQNFETYLKWLTNQSFEMNRKILDQWSNTCSLVSILEGPKLIIDVSSPLLCFGMDTTLSVKLNKHYCFYGGTAPLPDSTFFSFENIAVDTRK